MAKGGKDYRLEDDLMRKSVPKRNSKRFRRLEQALWASGHMGGSSICEICGKMLFNPHSILIHQGGGCRSKQKTTDEKKL